MARTTRSRSAGGRRGNDNRPPFAGRPPQVSSRPLHGEPKTLLVIGPHTAADKSRLHRACTFQTAGAKLHFVHIPFSWFGGEVMIGAANGIDVEYLYMQERIPLAELDAPIGESAHDWPQVVRDKLERDFDIDMRQVVGVLVAKYEGLLNDFRDILPASRKNVFLCA